MIFNNWNKKTIYLLVILNFSKLFYMYTAPLIYTHHFFTTDFVTYQLSPSMFYNIFCNSFIPCQLHLNLLKHLFTTVLYPIRSIPQPFATTFATLFGTPAAFLYSLEPISPSFFNTLFTTDFATVSINQSVNQWMNEWINQSINQSINPFLQQFSQQSILCMF